MLKRILLICALLPMIALSALATGCGKKEVENPEDRPKGRFAAGPNVGGAQTIGDPLKAASFDGVIRGRVVLKGEKPEIHIIDKMAAHNDHATCLAGKEFEKIDQKWILGEDGGVANVVIFLRAPAGKYFPVPENAMSRTDTVVVDQPHCAFIPHVTGAFPMDRTGKASGQQFVVKNSAPLSHNTGWKGDTLKTGSGNVTLKPKDELVIKLTPEPSPILLNCDVHPWMRAAVWAFDHPYYAVTKADGNFEIKDVPTGIDLGLVAWHEVPGFFNGGKEGKKQKFNPGENKVADLQISAK